MHRGNKVASYGSLYCLFGVANFLSLPYYSKLYRLKDIYEKGMLLEGELLIPIFEVVMYIFNLAYLGYIYTYTYVHIIYIYIYIYTYI